MKSSFKVVREMNIDIFAEGVEFYLNQGFDFYGDIKYLNNFYIQYMIKKDWRLDEECACITKEMRDKCLAFDNCLVRACENEWMKRKKNDQ